MGFQDELGDWVRMDGTTKLPVGKAPPHEREWWVEPGKEAKATGEGDFVGMSDGESDSAGGESILAGVGLAFPGIR